MGIYFTAVVKVYSSSVDDPSKTKLRAAKS